MLPNCLEPEYFSLFKVDLTIYNSFIPITFISGVSVEVIFYSVLKYS